jgi:hypothetical protein
MPTFITPWLGPPLLVVGIHIIAQSASNFHWSVELIVTLVYMVLGAVLLFGWKRRVWFGKQPNSTLFTIWLCTIFFMIESFASASSLLVFYQSSAYTGPNIPSRSALVDLYFYHFIDSIPGLKLWDTFSIPAGPYRQDTLLAGFLLLAFRAVVLAILIGALKDWLRSRGELRPPSSANPAKHAA